MRVRRERVVRESDTDGREKVVVSAWPRVVCRTRRHTTTRGHTWPHGHVRAAEIYMNGLGRCTNMVMREM